MKHFFFGLLICASFALSSCQNSQQQSQQAIYNRIADSTMGTYYRVIYQHPEGLDLKPDIDQLLQDVNMGTSTYIPQSLISRFNQSEQGVELNDGPASHLIRSYLVAKDIYQKSDGAFDPTVMHLVNYWGFGYTPRQEVTKVDSLAIDSLRQLVDFSRITFRENEGYLAKELPSIEMDLSACAKGHGVDAIAQLLEGKDVKNYLVDIGGESRASGVNDRGIAWQIGINLPLEGAGLNEVSFILPLDNQSIATSGNYRNFYVVDSQTYSHTINPKTGFPERTALLSASILAPDCATADGLATACMVLGADKALDLINNIPNTEAYLLVTTKEGGQKEIFSKGFPRGEDN